MSKVTTIRRYASVLTSVEAYLANLVDVVEGSKYTNDLADAGGPTRWGITQRTLSHWRGKPATADEVKNLSRGEALDIYRHEYVAQPGFDKIAEVSAQVALEMIDTGVNMGPLQATKYLQRALGVLYSGLVVDGHCGSKTVGMLKDYVGKRGERGVQVLVTALNCLQGGDYIRIAESDSSQRRFTYGWLSQRVFQNISDWAA